MSDAVMYMTLGYMIMVRKLSDYRIIDDSKAEKTQKGQNKLLNE